MLYEKLIYSNEVSIEFEPAQLSQIKTRNSTWNSTKLRIYLKASPSIPLDHWEAGLIC